MKKKVKLKECPACGTKQHPSILRFVAVSTVAHDQLIPVQMVLKTGMGTEMESDWTNFGSDIAKCIHCHNLWCV